MSIWHEVSQKDDVESWVETGTGLVALDDGLVEVAVPVYNEEAVLEANIGRLCRYLEEHFPFRWGVVVVDNASTDGTWAKAQALSVAYPAVRALHLDRKGRGLALRRAWETTDADVVAYMDVDLSTNLESLLPLVSPLLSGHSEVAIGSRLTPRSRVRRQLTREVISRTYNRLVRLFCATRVSDAQCGFKALRADAARRLLPEIENDNWFFDTELLLLAEQDGMRVYEVPVDWVEDRDSRVDLASTIREDLSGLWRMRRRARRLAAAQVDGPDDAGGKGDWRRAAPVAAIVALALGLNLWALERNGMGNQYYAAAVRSMSQSWHNFFFASFDPGGFITIDKPPLATWIQTGFVKLFGFNSWSLLLPSALAGAATVLLLYLAVTRAFGRAAGLVAALVLALTPINVAVNRSNNPDALLVLLVVGAAWALQRSLDTGRLRHLLLASVALALAFNTKTLEAYIVVPALWFAYLVGAPRRLRVRVGHLAVASTVLLGLSAAWVVAVDAVPAQNRPYVGSSTDNSAVNLAFGYNGLGRLNGQGEHRRRAGAKPETAKAVPAGSGVPSAAGPAAAGTGPGAGGGQPSFDFNAFRDRDGFGGRPGIGRLLSAGVGDQGGWLLPLAAVGGLAGLVLYRRRGAAVVLWAGWLATSAIVFSFAKGIFHSYYISLLEPAAAALIGIGVVALARSGARRWTRLAAAGALAVTAAAQLSVLGRFPGYAPWLAPVLVTGTCAAVVLVLAGFRQSALAGLGLAVGSGALLAAPAVWSLSTVHRASGGPMVTAGPMAHRVGRGGGGGRSGLFGSALGPVAPGSHAEAGSGRVGSGGFAAFFNGGMANQAKLIGFLEANRSGARYLAATTNAISGAPLILKTGEPVMAMGGFIGVDPAVSASSLARLIDQGEVRYFLIGGGFAGGWPPGNDVAVSCTEVPAADWGGPASPPEGSPAPDRFVLHLYDCQHAGSRVAAAALHPGPAAPPGG